MTPLHSACKVKIGFEFTFLVHKDNLIFFSYFTKNGKSNVIEFIRNEFNGFDSAKLKDLISRRDSNNHSAIDICVASNNETCSKLLNSF